jgi:hypothetical protein
MNFTSDPLYQAFRSQFLFRILSFSSFSFIALGIFVNIKRDFRGLDEQWLPKLFLVACFIMFTRWGYKKQLKIGVYAEGLFLHKVGCFRWDEISKLYIDGRSGGRGTRLPILKVELKNGSEEMMDLDFVNLKFDDLDQALKATSFEDYFSITDEWIDKFS